MNYIKICPSCNRHNPEAARVCENAQCKKFLGQVKPVQDLGPERETPPQPFKESETIGQHGPEDYDSMKPGDVGCTKRSSEPFFYLECRTASKIYEVHSGQVVGRKDPPAQPIYRWKAYLILTLYLGSTAVSTTKTVLGTLQYYPAP